MSTELDGIETIKVSSDDVARVLGQGSGGATPPRVRALVIKIDEEAESQALTDDPFEDEVNSGLVIPPPLPLLELAMLPEYSTALGPSIATMISNIDSTGHRFVGRFTPDTVPQDLRRKVREEEARTYDFFESCVIDADGDLTFLTLRENTRWDLESGGNGYWEVVRDLSKPGVLGPILGFRHLPQHTMRVGYQIRQRVKYEDRYVRHISTWDAERDGPEVIIPDPMGAAPDASPIEVPFRFEYGTKVRRGRFRRYLQRRGGKRVWFKQFGDPRVMNAKTGSYDPKTKPGDRATEVIHFRLYSPRTPYGLPRYVGNILGITGERAAENVCYVSMHHNQVPALALMAIGGQVTQATVNRIKQFLKDQISGKDNFSSVLILEMEPDEADFGEPGHAQMKLEPLSKWQHTDGLFKEYRDGQRNNIRQAFRIPALYWGEIAGVGKAGAEARRLADQQVFAPARRKFDERITRQVFPHIGRGGVTYWKFNSNSPDLTDNESLIKMAAVAERTGAMTPEIARAILAEVLNRDLGPVTGIKADVPYSIQLGMILSSAGKPESSLSIPGERADQRSGALTDADMVGGGEIEQSDESAPPAIPAPPADLPVATQEAMRSFINDYLGGPELSMVAGLRDALNTEAAKRGWGEGEGE